MGYAYSNEGLTFRAWDDSSTIESGEVYFDHTPTTTELTAAFPGTTTVVVAGSCPFTVTNQFVVGDTVAFDDVTLIAVSSDASTDQFVVGSDIATSATNLAAALNADSTVSKIYTVSASDTVITVTETTAGGGNTPESMTVTGTGVISAGTATTSTAATTTGGYTEAVKEAQITVLDAEYQAQFNEISQAYLTAVMAGDTTTAAARQTDYTTLRTEYISALEAV